MEKRFYVRQPIVGIPNYSVYDRALDDPQGRMYWNKAIRERLSEDQAITIAEELNRNDERDKAEWNSPLTSADPDPDNKFGYWD